MEMEEENKTTVQLTRLYCRSLNLFNFFRKPALYATVSLVSATGRRVSDQEYRTDTDRVGGCNPDWGNNSFSLHIIKPFLEQEDAVFVKFEIFCHGTTILPDRKVGEVQVALKTLVDDFNGAVRFQEHRIRGHNNNAALHFSHKLINGTNIKNGGVAATSFKVSYFASTGMQLSVESIVMAPTNWTRQVQQRYSTLGSIYSQPVPYRANSYVSRGATTTSTVGAEVNGGEIKEEGVPV